jgi:hypothetical protein
VRRGSLWRCALRRKVCKVVERVDTLCSVVVACTDRIDSVCACMGAAAWTLRQAPCTGRAAGSSNKALHMPGPQQASQP